ncbi:MAG TPA: glycosyltransferase [Polyangia bacterium]|nr:glycosyltransferase [Polyangia bacterium]
MVSQETIDEKADNKDEDVRIDLHVHSSASDKPYSWFLRSAQSAECYTTPRQVYDIAQSRGMNLVTLCDHDSITGALELCALAPNTFISEEISARFPEDGCVVHAIALHISEAQHVEIQRLRSNIYQLMQYLDGAGIEVFLCHALSQVNRRLTPSHIRRCLLMFRNLELRNGTRDRAHEDALTKITGGLTPATLARWAEQHPGVPFLNQTARYAFVGGSDDHAGLSIARAFTTFRGQRSGAGVTRALRERTVTPDGAPATSDVLSHNIYGVVAAHLAHAHDDGGDGEGEGDADGNAAAPSMQRTVEQLATMVMESGVSLDLGELRRTGHTDATQTKMADVLETVLLRTGRQSLGAVAGALGAVRPAEAIDALPDLVRSLLLAVPALAGGRYHAHDRRTARAFAADLGYGIDGGRPLRVAVLSDSLDEVNGVALGLRRLAERARRAGRDLRLIGVGDGDRLTVDGDGIVRIPALARFPLPLYPQQPLDVPHLPTLLTYLVNEEIDLVQCSTPGPVGLAGLLAGRLAGVPVIGQFHTDIPVYATRLTGDPVVGAIAARYVGWFYNALDEVLVPSHAVADRLRELQVSPDKLRFVPRGIDLDLFSPARRDPHAFQAFGLDGEPKVLYVGRLSREKGLDALVDGFRRQVRDQVPSARLLFIGDGPHAAQLARQSAPDLDGRLIFTGEMTGERLASLVASSDLFVYPSETETFGNAVVEAQAAGLPVIVASRGAARENMVEGVTGLVVDAQKPDQIGGAIRHLLRQPELRRRMGREAAQFAKRYDMGVAARATFDLYGEILRGMRGTADVGAAGAGGAVTAKAAA